LANGSVDDGYSVSLDARQFAQGECLCSMAEACHRRRRATRRRWAVCRNDDQQGEKNRQRHFRGPLRRAAV